MEEEKEKNIYALLPCPKCGGSKSKVSHTYGSYKVYHNNTRLKLRCKACRYIQRFRYIDGGV